MSDIGTCLKRGADTLASVGIESPWREARLLLVHATNLTEAELIGYPERAIAAGDDFDRLIRRRARREPLSHLLGQREFWSLTFEVTAETLDPRPDSETIIERISERTACAQGALVRLVETQTRRWGGACALRVVKPITPLSD